MQQYDCYVNVTLANGYVCAIDAPSKKAIVTGIPYHADWRSADYSDWVYKSISDKGSYLRVDDASFLGTKLGCIISPTFYLPTGSLAVYPQIAMTTGGSSASKVNRSYIYAGTRSSSASESGDYIEAPFKAADAEDPNIGFTALGKAITLSTSTPCMVFTAKDFSPAVSTNIYQVKITY